MTTRINIWTDLPIHTCLLLKSCTRRCGTRFFPLRPPLMVPLHNKLLRGICQNNPNTGILTCNPSVTPKGLTLGPNNSQLINIAAKTLGIRRLRFSRKFATHTGILTPPHSSKSYDPHSLHGGRSSTTDPDKSEPIQSFGSKFSPD